MVAQVLPVGPRDPPFAPHFPQHPSDLRVAGLHCLTGLLEVLSFPSPLGFEVAGYASGEIRVGSGNLVFIQLAEELRQHFVQAPLEGFGGIELLAAIEEPGLPLPKPPTLPFCYPPLPR